VAGVAEPDYQRLLFARTRLREFERWSAEQARAQGLTAAQHQLLLAVRGHADRRGPTIGEVAQYLIVRHHTAVELVDRCVELGLVARQRDPADGRVVRLAVTRSGRQRLDRLATAHAGELARLVAVLEEVTRHLGSPPANGAGSSA
jgi:DNA-binding MarR family transcriptional regulator